MLFHSNRSNECKSDVPLFRLGRCPRDCILIGETFIQSRSEQMWPFARNRQESCCRVRVQTFHRFTLRADACPSPSYRLLAALAAQAADSKLYVLHWPSLIWSTPVCDGVAPSPRCWHSTSILGVTEGPAFRAILYGGSDAVGRAQTDAYCLAAIGDIKVSPRDGRWLFCRFGRCNLSRLRVIALMSRPSLMPQTSARQIQ